MNGRTAGRTTAKHYASVAYW